MARSRTDGRLTDAERLDWLRLIRSDHIGPRTFHALLQHFGSAAAALDGLPELARRGGAAQGGRICSPADAARELDAARDLGFALIALKEPDYPLRLRAIHDPPPLIAVAGDPATLARPSIALVGSRNASAVGIKMAERLARDLGASGFIVVSGLARGIDAAAHRGSLASGTVAVLAGGLDRVYPEEHADLVASITGSGAAISEMPLGWEPRARDFPRRNRLISGLSLGVVLVEAAARSGSLITARCALEQGREVFAVPGSPLDPRAEGTNRLLKQGATLVTEAADVVSVLEPMLKQVPGLTAKEPDSTDPPARLPEPGDDQRQRIIGLLGPSPVGIDDLVRLSGASPAVVRMVLLELTLAGRLERHGDGMVSLV